MRAVLAGLSIRDMPIFDAFERTDVTYAAYGEGNFAFLNRSHLPQFEAAREMIEGWFASYPPEEQAELASRFRDKNNPPGFDAAFFELFLHEFFVRGGCRVEIHPRSDGSSKRPDFLITTPASRQFYLEAIVASGTTKEERAIRSRRDDLYNALNRVNSPDYFVSLRHYEFKPSTPIPVSRIRRDVQRWIDGLDYEAVMAIPKDDIDSLPSHLVEHDGHVARLVAIPKKREYRGQPDAPALGGHSGDVAWVKTHEDVRAALKKKSASRYDLGGLPYVVAVRCPDLLTREVDVERSLFGLTSTDPRCDADRLAFADLEDGTWAGGRGATNTSISGVLSVWNVFPWSVRPGAMCLYKNPWPKSPLGSEELGVSEAYLTPSGVEYMRRDALLRM